MKIGIDARLLERRITGIGRVLITLLNDIPKFDSKNNYFLFTYSPVDFNSSFYTNIKTIKSILPQKLFAPIWSNFILPYYLKKNKMDILFSVNQIIPLIKVKGCKYISIVHDVIYKADPNFLPFIYRKYLQFFAYFSIHISDSIITDSEYSKKDILKHYKVDEKKIKVILPAAKKDFHPIDLGKEEINEIKSKYNLPEYIVLYVGMIENRKNIPGILKVADLINEKRSDVGFVLIGKKGYGGKAILKEVAKRTNAFHLTNIDDGLLKKFYNLADVFLFPSKYEGFGYPPLEAMQSGLPVISANNTSLKEIVGDGGIMHNFDDYNSMADDIIRLLEDSEYRSELIKRGFQQAKKFNSDSTVTEFLTVFNSFENKKYFRTNFKI